MPWIARLTQCFGFSLPVKFTAPDAPIVPNDELFVPYSSNTYFATGKLKFANGKSISPNDVCKHPPQ